MTLYMFRINNRGAQNCRVSDPHPSPTDRGEQKMPPARPPDLSSAYPPERAVAMPHPVQSGETRPKILYNRSVFGHKPSCLDETRPPDTLVYLNFALFYTIMFSLSLSLFSSSSSRLHSPPSRLERNCHSRLSHSLILAASLNVAFCHRDQLII